MNILMLHKYSNGKVSFTTKALRNRKFAAQKKTYFNAIQLMFMLLNIKLLLLSNFAFNSFKCILLKVFSFI